MSIKQAIEALPPLPSRMIAYDTFHRQLEAYTAEQMREYALAALRSMPTTLGKGITRDDTVHGEEYFTRGQVESVLRSMPAEPVASAGRMAQLKAALQAAGDLAASSRSGPAKAESLQGIEEICTEALEHRSDRCAPFVSQLVHDIANEICQAVAELPDRNSPEDWPEAMLVTHDELRLIVTEALATPHTEAVRMSEAEIRRWWSSENGFEDLDMCKIDDFRTMVRAVEQATAARLGVKMGDV